MNLLLPTDKESIRLHSKKNQKHEHFLFSGKIRKGLSLFEFDPKTGLLSKVIIDKTVFFNAKTKRPEYRKKAGISSECWHIQALNFKNAVRKIKKVHKGEIIIKKQNQ